MGQASDIHRRCAVTRNLYAKSAMIRFCIAPDKVVTPDIRGKLPGRGIWVHAGVVADAIKTNVFAKSARSQAIIPDGLYTVVEKLLYSHIVDLIHGAKRSGKGVSGFEKVKDALKANTLAIVFSTAGNSADGHKKLQGMCRMLNVTFCTDLYPETVENVWHHTYAGIKKCGIAHGLQNEIRRYGLFQNGDLV